MSFLSRLFPILFATISGVAVAFAAHPQALLENYCFDCHDGEIKKGGLDMIELTEGDKFDGTLMFENLITGKMPPANKKQPTAAERRRILEWLAQKQPEVAADGFRRISRHEFVHSLNDLLGTDLDLAGQIPDDRGTNHFDSDRRIKLGQEMLASYFAVADEMLEAAFPGDGFPHEQRWVTNKLVRL